MNSRFTSSIYEAITVLLLVGYLFRSLSLLIHLLAYAMKLWAIYLMVSGGISCVSKILLAISRDTYPAGIEWKVLIVLSGVLILWMAVKKIELVQVETEDNF